MQIYHKIKGFFLLNKNGLPAKNKSRKNNLAHQQYFLKLPRKYMAKISITDFKITTSDNNKVTPKVTYKVTFSEGEMNLMKIFPGLFKVRCELWGADSGLNGDDDKLFVYPAIHTYPDSNPAKSETKTFIATLNIGAELDEDWESDDDIYAKVVLTNTFTESPVRSVKSKEIHGSY